MPQQPEQAGRRCGRIGPLLLAAVLVLGGCWLVATRSAPPAGPPSYLRGVNVAGAEFGTSSDFDSDASFAFYARRGHELLRIPFRWESVQPTPGGALNEAYLAQLVAAVNSSTSRGMITILDVHNYYRHNGDVVGGGTVTSAHFTDLWSRLADRFKGNALVEFGLMNEPHDVPGGAPAVEALAQDAVTAIRATGAANFIWVSGDAWSSAASYGERHPRWWINDPLVRSGPEAHYYFDAGNQHIGSYPHSVAQDEAAARQQGFLSLTDKVQTELGRFVTYCEDNGLRCLIGEMGWPNASSAATSPNDALAWNAVAEAAYAVLDAGGLDVTYWAAGEQWGDGYNLSAYTGSPQRAATSVAPVVEAHPSTAGAADRRSAREPTLP